MTDLPPDCAAIFRTVLDSPTDPLPKLVLADYLDERGEPLLAHGFRWCAAYGRHPEWSRGSAGGKAASVSMTWSGVPYGLTIADYGPWWLPYCVYEVLTMWPHYDRLSLARTLPRGPSAWEHFAALADALESITAVVRLPRD